MFFLNLQPVSTNNRTSSNGDAAGTSCINNSPNNRSVWFNYSIDTDYENIAPNTGITLEYWLEAKEVNLAPDGFNRSVMTIHGTIPGPTLFADWGDWVTVHVTNNLEQPIRSTQWIKHSLAWRSTELHRPKRWCRLTHSVLSLLAQA